MLNVRHPPEVHGQVGRAEVQEVEEAELQRHAAVTQPVPGEGCLTGRKIQLQIQKKSKFVFMHTIPCEILTLFAM